MFKNSKKLSDFINDLSCRHSAFTLSEVLVTLAILGVIAAVTIPAVMQVTPSRTKVMYRKAYYVVERAISNMSNDDTNYPSSILDGSNNQRWFNYTTAVSNGSTNKFCYLFFDQLNVVGSATSSCQDTSTSGLGGTSIVTPDGINWRIYLAGSDAAPNSQFPITKTDSSYPTKIVIDVNGSNGPNCFTDSGYNTYKYTGSYTQTLCTDNNPDSFIIGVRYDGKLQIGSGVDATGTSTSTDDEAVNILSDPTNNRKS